MPKEKSILRQIAEIYDKDIKTITRHIKSHPELGIVLEERKAPTLSEEQIQGLCAILDEQYKRPEAVNEALRRVVLGSQNSTDNDADSHRSAQESDREVAELKAQIAQLKTDLEVEKARTEELRSRVSFAEQQVPKLLEESTEKSRQIEALREDVHAAKDEVAAAREEWKSKGLFDRWFKR